MKKIPFVLNREECTWQAVRSSGAGGQNIQKVSTAIVLEFNLAASSLPAKLRERAARLYASQLTASGSLIIKAQTQRTQGRNLVEAFERLEALLEAASWVPERRIATKPTRGSVRRRLEAKSRRSLIKAGRGRVRES